MPFHQGRLIDHVELVVRDLAASRRFYDAVLGAIGRSITFEGTGIFAADELCVGQGEAISHLHLAFQAADREAVHRFHAAALAAGGRDNGGPGERRHYHTGYYAAFVLDPDGNNIEAVYHGPTERSADSVVVNDVAPT